MPAQTPKPLPQLEQPAAPAHERRQWERRAASGEVVIWLKSAAIREVRGQLLDVSDGGFRMVHDGVDLPAGALVAFYHPYAHGVARIIWNRRVGNSTESGFFLLTRVRSIAQSAPTSARPS
jgi:hypothetical protein